MVRTFETHRVRKTQELTDCLWEFATMPEQGEPVKRQVTVPSCWESYPDTRTYRGKGGYTRTFTAAGTIRLEFKGVGHLAQVYVDGNLVKTHYNAYTIFSVVVPNLAAGEHTLEVQADNAFGPWSALHVPNDYESYGGILRPVMLEALSAEAYLTQVHFTPSQQDGVWTTTLEATVQGLTEANFAGSLHFSVAGAECSMPVCVHGAETVTVTQTLTCPEALAWMPEAPALYKLETVLQNEAGEAVDDLIDQVGFRAVTIAGKDILLNGRKLRIKGFCRHEEHPQFGCALPLAAMQQDIMLMQDMGANSVRTSHYPNDELFLDLCDEQGILVWEENHARGLSEEQMRNPNFERQCEDCIREMIAAHYNHPSIYIWGILNECASHTEYGRQCYQKQYDQIKALDASRPRSSASCQFKTDVCFGMPEVVSYNLYPLWYHETPADEYMKDMYNWVQKETKGAGKPYLITEIGAGAIYGYRTPTKVKWSEEYQAEAIEQQLNAVFGTEGISGVYIWQYCDGRVCDSWFFGRPKTMNNKGIVDEFRRPKLSYEVVKRIFSGLGTYFD